MKIVPSSQIHIKFVHLKSYQVTQDVSVLPKQTGFLEEHVSSAMQAALRDFSTAMVEAKYLAWKNHQANIK